MLHQLAYHRGVLDIPVGVQRSDSQSPGQIHVRRDNGGTEYRIWPEHLELTQGRCAGFAMVDLEHEEETVPRGMFSCLLAWALLKETYPP